MKIDFNNIINVQSLMNEIKLPHSLNEIDKKTKIIAGAIIGALALLLVIGLLYRRFTASKDSATTTDEKKAVPTDNSTTVQTTDQKLVKKQPEQVNKDNSLKEATPQKPAEANNSQENQSTPHPKKPLNATEKTQLAGAVIKPNQSTQTTLTTTPTTQPALKPTTPTTQKTNPAQDTPSTLPTELTVQQPESNTTALPSTPAVPATSIGQTPIVEDPNDAPIDAVVQERILYLGSEGKHLQASELIQLEAEFEIYSQNAEEQKLFGNEREGVIFISLNTFGKSTRLYNTQLQAFIRHLVLNNKIHAYNPSVRNGICLYLTRDALEKYIDSNDILNTSPNAPRFFDRKKLLEMDDYMQEIEAKFPHLVDDNDIIEGIFSDIRKLHYSRISQNYFGEKQVSKDKLSIFKKPTPKILDTLVEHGTIQAWTANANQQTPIFRIAENDPINQSNLRPWRDLTKIEEEKEFQKNNRLDKDKILALDIKISGVPLDASETEALSKLVNQLNRRVKHGPFTWKPTTTTGAHVWDEVFKKLTDEGMIHSYERKFVSNSFEYKIHVKEIDVPKA